jgi:hypothetical protein
MTSTSVEPSPSTSDPRRCKACFPPCPSPKRRPIEPAAQRAAGGLIANAAVEAGAEDVQLRLTHGALEAEDQAVVEQGRVVDAVGIGDLGIGHAAQIEEPVPVSVIAGQARDLEAQDDADLGQGDIGRQPGEAGALGDPRTREAQVVVDDGDLLAVPAEIDGAMDQRVLPLRRLAWCSTCAGLDWRT